MSIFGSAKPFTLPADPLPQPGKRIEAGPGGFCNREVKRGWSNSRDRNKILKEENSWRNREKVFHERESFQREVNENINFLHGFKCPGRTGTGLALCPLSNQIHPWERGAEWEPKPAR
jgi:hypothetical protein